MIKYIVDEIKKSILITITAGAQVSLHEDESFIPQYIEYIEVQVAQNVFISYICKTLMHTTKRVTLFTLAESSECTVILQEQYTHIQEAHREIIFQLQEPYAQATCKGSYYAKEHANVSFKIQQIHNASYTKSDVLIKSIVDNSAQFAYQGTIVIMQDMQQIQAQQYNKNLLLSDHAYVHSMPILEIQAHDVSCAHGSAVSYLQEEHLFYCAARGISLDQAKKIILEGFLLLD